MWLCVTNWLWWWSFFSIPIAQELRLTILMLTILDEFIWFLFGRSSHFIRELFNIVLSIYVDEIGLLYDRNWRLRRENASIKFRGFLHQFFFSFLFSVVGIAFCFLIFRLCLKSKKIVNFRFNQRTKYYFNVQIDGPSKYWYIKIGVNSVGIQLVPTVNIGCHRLRKFHHKNQFINRNYQK